MPRSPELELQAPARRWELRASDLTARALERARRGVFRLQRLELLPPCYLQRFCLRGVGDCACMLRLTYCDQATAAAD